MIVTIESLGYQLRPYHGSTCWELYEWTTDRRTRSGEPKLDAWMPCGVYPSSLEHGLRIILERASRRSSVASDLRAVLAEMQRLTDEVIRALSNLSPPHSSSRPPKVSDAAVEDWL